MAEWTDERIEAVARAALRDESRARPVQLTSPDILARRRSRSANGTRPRVRRGPLLLAAVLTIGVGSLALLPASTPPDVVPERSLDVGSDRAVIIRTEVDGQATIVLADATDEQPVATLELEGHPADGQHSVSPTGWLQLIGPWGTGRTILDIADPSHRVSFDDATALEFGPDGRAWILRGRGSGAVLELFDPVTDTSSLVRTSADGLPTQLVVRADGEAVIPRAGSFPPAQGAGVRFWYGLEATGLTRPGEPYLARYDGHRLPSPDGDVLVVCSSTSGPCPDLGPVTESKVTSWPGPDGRHQSVLDGLPSGAEVREATWAPPAPWPPSPWVRPGSLDFGVWITATSDGAGRQGELWHLDADGAPRLVLTFPLRGGIMDPPTFSSDGSLVAIRMGGPRSPATTVLGDLGAGAARHLEGTIGGFVSGEVAARLLGRPSP